MRVLFVCMGNICRSPTAEGVARAIRARRGLVEQVDIDSAGTHGYHVGASPDSRSTATAKRHGIDLAGLRSRQVEAADLDRFDLVLAMDNANLEDLLALKVRHGGSAEIHRLLDYAGGGEVPDPYFGAGDGFERVFEAVQRGCEALFDDIEARLRPVD
ncbi:MAG: low molecular weight protein-tyrosine-phosphatase [Salinisphaeraceae bacterium]